MLKRLELGAGTARAELYPGRGGLVTRFLVGDRSVLYLDEATLLDETKNVRGGIPILFPTAGRLSGDRFLKGDESFPMKQHGFARNLPWVTEEKGPSTARLRLTSSDLTRAAFPFDFRLEFTFTVSPSALRIDQRYENRSPEPMPLHAGFHPYFALPDAEKGRTAIPTAATRAFDNVKKSEVVFDGFDLTAPEVDLHLVDHGATAAELRAPSGTIEVRASAEFTRWVVWTLAGKDFVCLEPWTAPGNALNTGQGLLWLAPGEARSLWIEIEAR